jgi:class 3 adenylate cyclase
VRIGLHTGECDLRAGIARGIVSDIGNRVAALAVANEVLVSRTVVDLVAGSGLQFDDRGTPPPGPWRSGMERVRGTAEIHNGRVHHRFLTVRP